MEIIKLDATASTNTYLKHLVKEKACEDYTIVVCEHQTQGRGQKGNSWYSERGKNLTVSILKKFEGLDVGDSFSLNCAVSLAILDVLNMLSIPDVQVKWPNDIMAGNKKLCGILIENNLVGAEVKYSIIGFGLNVNQENFGNYKHATSLKLSTGNHYNLEEILGKILNRLEEYFESFFPNKLKDLRTRYHLQLFRRNKWFEYIDQVNQITFIGKIIGTTPSGQLEIETKEGVLRTYNFKEIEMVY